MTALHDIEDVEVFARKMVGVVRHHIIENPLTPDQWDDLQDEAVVILYELAPRYEHHRPGYEQPGSFAGYASKYVPKRLLDRLGTVAQDTFDGYNLEFPPGAAQNKWEPNVPDGGFMLRLPAWDRGPAERVMQLMEEGYTTDKIAARLRYSRGDVSRLMREIAEAAHAPAVG